MLNKLRTYALGISLILVSIASCQMHTAAFMPAGAGAGVLPYTKNNQGERMYLVGFNAHKSTQNKGNPTGAFCDFGGFRTHEESQEAAAVREFNEETLDYFRLPQVRGALYLEKHTPSYRMYLIYVPYVSAQDLNAHRQQRKNALMQQHRWSDAQAENYLVRTLGAEPKRFSWIKESELLPALQQETSIGITVQHRASDGRIYSMPLSYAFVGMLRNGTAAGGAVGLVNVCTSLGSKTNW